MVSFDCACGVRIEENSEKEAGFGIASDANIGDIKALNSSL